MNPTSHSAWRPFRELSCSKLRVELARSSSLNAERKHAPRILSMSQWQRSKGRRYEGGCIALRIVGIGSAKDDRHVAGTPTDLCNLRRALIASDDMLDDRSFCHRSCWRHRLHEEAPPDGEGKFRTANDGEEPSRNVLCEAQRGRTVQGNGREGSLVGGGPTEES
jgi:hypothetical protein